MEQLLRFLVQNTHRGALRNMWMHLLSVRTASELGDCVLLLLLFVGCYLLMFRLRFYLRYQTPDHTQKRKGAKGHRKQGSGQRTHDPNVLAWLYLVGDPIYENYRAKHPKGCKVLFVYNLVTVSVYLLSALLTLPALFSPFFRMLFLDLFFLHMYTNILPKCLFDALLWFHNRITSDEAAVP